MDTKEIYEWVKSIDTKLDNHIKHFVADLAKVRLDIALMQSDLAWIKKGVWTVASTVIIGIVGAVLALIIK